MSDKWVFDEAVADRFQEEALRHIPLYDRTIELTSLFAQKLCSSSSTVVDVGCALGETLGRYRSAGFERIHGVDSSEAMVTRCRCRHPYANVILSDEFPDIPCEFVSANWTLHFVRSREEYLRRIHRNLSSSGALFLTEKVSSSEAVREAYLDFKRSNHLTEEEIARKSKSLSGVLITYPVSWYFTTLRNVGFSSVEVVSAYPNFVSFLAKKAP